MLETACVSGVHQIIFGCLCMQGVITCPIVSRRIPKPVDTSHLSQRQFKYPKAGLVRCRGLGFYKPLRLSLVTPRLLQPTVIIKSPLPWVPPQRWLSGRFSSFYMLGFSSMSLPSCVGFENSPVGDYMVMVQEEYRSPYLQNKGILL